MVKKYELLTDEEILNIIKYQEKERLRNKQAYEKLKLNKVKCRQKFNKFIR